jgi:hypothetical protein
MMNAVLLTTSLLGLVDQGIIKDHSCRENLACSDDKEDDAEDEAEEQSVRFQASSIEKVIGNNSWYETMSFCLL